MGIMASTVAKISVQIMGTKVSTQAVLCCSTAPECRLAGEYIKTWRRRWFVLKQGKIFWFKSDIITPVRASEIIPCNVSLSHVCEADSHQKLKRYAAPPSHVQCMHCANPPSRAMATSDGATAAARRPCCPVAVPCAETLRPPAQDSQPRGVIEVNKCLSIKGAEDRVNKPHAFEISTVEESMFFIADSDKVGAGFRVTVRIHSTG